MKTLRSKTKKNAQAKHNQRKKQNKKSSALKTNTVSVGRLMHLKYLLLQLAMVGRMIVLLFSPQWQTLKDSVPGFKNACDKLQTLFNGLNQKLDDYRKVIKNVAAEKKLARQALAEAGYRLMNSCRSYAALNGLTALEIKMTVTLSRLFQMKYSALISLMNNSAELIQPLIPKADFNITQNIYDDLMEKIAAAQSLENGPKSAISQRKSIGGDLFTDMKATMNFFENELLPLASNFRSNNSFWYAFVNAKHIGKPDNFHCRLVAHCEDELGNSIYGITISVDTFIDPATGKTYKSASAVTNADGDAEVSGFYPAHRSVTISGPGIETKTFTFTFRKGKAFVHTFTVSPAFDNIPAPQETRQKVKAN